MYNKRQQMLFRSFLISAALVLIIGFSLASSIRAEDASGAKPSLTNATLNQIMLVLQHTAEATVPNQAGLRILQAFYGTDGSWRDVTSVVQTSTKQNSLQILWQQPYSEVGGDPAYGRVKTLVIAYQLDGKTRLGAFQETGDISELHATIH